MAGRAKTDAAKADKSKAAGPPPNQTLYCRNLTDKMPKKDLKRELYLLFSTYGSVLDIVTMKTMKMRGQAHIVFQDISKATQAMRNLDEKDFHGKKMIIQYARSKSNFVAKLDGTFNQPHAAQPTPAPAPTTSLQQSIFNNPPSALPAPPGVNGVDSPASVDSSKRKNEDLEAGDAKRTKIEQPPADEEDDDEAEMEMDESD
ncbi:rna recognition domain-containing protein [Diplodia corticola]|uniref:Rna recognition domain-containing protein n=1 Tax=Diplodia corticola TaxID=236234 RepID=A0A1J9S3M7_9PEZI|nr:rna recognition domain-containing protein [Diplodia corticola]OJD35159.1 rna recognition domain-containing protein [Diplodia corticola]